MNVHRSVTIVALTTLCMVVTVNVLFLVAWYATWIPAWPLAYGFVLVLTILTRRLSFPIKLYPSLDTWNRKRIRSMAMGVVGAIAVQVYCAYRLREFNALPTPDHGFSLSLFVKANLIVAVFGVLIGIRERNEADDILQEAERKEAGELLVHSGNPTSVPLL